MLAFGLGLASGLVWGAADFVGGLMTRRLAPATVLVVGQGAGLATTATLVVLLGEPRPAARFLLIGALGGLAGAIGLASLYRGLAVGPMSIVAPAAALSGAIPVVAGLAQGERPAPVQLAGILLAAVGIVLAARATDGPSVAVGPDLAVARAPRPTAPSRPSVAALGYAAAAALGLGLVMTALDAAAAGGSALWASMMVRASSVPLFLVAWLLRPRGGERRPSPGELGVVALVGLADNLANVLFALAANTGLLAVVSVLGSLYPVTTVLLARAVLHERLSRSQSIGVAAALGGVALIAGG
ncbi:MAG: membrane protein [Actinomycetota bacterium]|nr:MAG: membrane protein [Actinomycetota bacterium]